MFIVLSNEGDTDIFYDNVDDKIETFIYFDVMKDRTIVDKKYIISNMKLQILFSKHFVVKFH